MFRRASLLIAFSLVAARLSSADLPFTFEVPYTIIVPYETVQILPGEDALGAACGTTNVHGCTSFYGRRLDSRCFASGDVWRLRARAQFIPNIIVADAPVLYHERMHIDEVRGFLDDHLAALTAQDFPSYSDCDAVAQKASAVFPALMDAFQRQSNERHHPSYVQQLEAR